MNDAIIGVRVQIKPRSHYHGRFAGELGEIVRIYEGNVAVRIDGISNIRSKYGAFWFSEKEIEIIESEEISMNGRIPTRPITTLFTTATSGRKISWLSRPGTTGWRLPVWFRRTVSPMARCPTDGKSSARWTQQLSRNARHGLPSLLSSKLAWTRRSSSCRRRQSTKCWPRRTRSWRLCSRRTKTSLLTEQKGA